MRCLPMLVALAAAAAALQPVHDARGDGFLSGKAAFPDDLLEVVECIEDAANAQLASPMLLSACCSLASTRAWARTAARRRTRTMSDGSRWAEWTLDE